MNPKVRPIDPARAAELDALAEKYRGEWGLLEPEHLRPPARPTFVRRVRCASYPELPVFPTLKAAASWAGVHVTFLCQRMGRGEPCQGLVFEYADAGAARGAA